MSAGLNSWTDRDRIRRSLEVKYERGILDTRGVISILDLCECMRSCCDSDVDGVCVCVCVTGDLGRGEEEEEGGCIEGEG